MQGLLATVLVLAWCAASAAVPQPAAKVRLEEAQDTLEKGRALTRAGKYAEAVPLVERALELREAALGARHPEVAGCLTLLGELHILRGDLEGAERLFLRALGIREEALGKKHPNVAVTLNSLASLYMDQGLYVRAEPLYERALKVFEASVGDSHPNVATTLNNLAQLYVAQGLYARAEPLYERALKIFKASVGNRHPHVATTLTNLALLHMHQGHYARALPLFERALHIVEATLGGKHPEVARALNNLALLHMKEGRYTHAKPLFERVLKIAEVALGTNHPNVALALNNLANIYVTQGLYAQAEPLLVRALKIREAALSTSPLDIAHSLNSLAVLYKYQGLYTRAKPLYERALKLKTATLGGAHPDVAVALGNLASLFMAQGRYADAEPLYSRAFEIRRSTLGPHHPDIAHSLNNLADLFVEQGFDLRAESLYERALQILEAAHGANHPEVAAGLDRLALVYTKRGLFTRAEPLYERSLEIRKATFGEKHPVVADSLGNLAGLYFDQGLYTRAEPLFVQARELNEAIFGGKHPRVATSLNNLATLYLYQGQYTRAEPLLVRARAIAEAALGTTHPDTVRTLENLAALHIAQQQIDAALPLIQRSLTASEQNLRQQVHAFSDQRLAAFLQILRGQEEILYSLVRAYPRHPRVLRLALSAALLRQGRSVQEVANTSQIIYRNLKPADREALERLRGLRAQFATLSLAGPGSLSLPDYQRRLTFLKYDGDALEAALARRSEQFRRLHVLPSPEKIISRARAALPRDGALIEFVAYYDRPLVPGPGSTPAELLKRQRYLALLLFPDGRMHALDLGPAEPLERASSKLKDVLATTAPYEPAAQELYALTFRHLAPHLSQVQHLFIVPDGQLNVVPFAALHDGHQVLAESFDITYLTSGKDLLPRPRARRPLPDSVVVLADPTFAALPESSPAAPTDPSSTQRSASLESLFSTLPTQRGNSSWVQLDATREEAQAVHRLFPRAHLLMGPLATKQALLSLSAPGILHIATHGFFLEAAPPPAPLHASRAVVSSDSAGSPMPKCPAEALLCSGLVFAGANASAKHAGTHPVEQSWVTALELAGMDLWGTQLVVLSACNTGRGDVKLGQGVAGLRRALVTAGAETLVTSLWSVNDNTTALLMEDYYQRLRQGQGRTSALREAMSELRKKKPHPHFWAPFIAIGLDAPLKGLSSLSRAQLTP